MLINQPSRLCLLKMLGVIKKMADRIGVGSLFPPQTLEDLY